MFGTEQESLTYYREIEANHRKTRSQGAVHPDLCPKLTLHGVDFAIPPRGVEVRPVFDGESVRTEMGGEQDWPQADTLLRSAPVVAGQKCPACGQTIGAELVVELTDSAEFLHQCFALSGKLLRAQYSLSGGQLADLLAFGATESPQWIAQLLRWCQSMPTTAVPSPRPDELLQMMQQLRQPLQPESQPETDMPPAPRRWWQIWK